MQKAEHHSSKHPEWLESVYERLAEDDEGRVCKDISESACKQTPGNFFRMLVANTLSSLADRIVSTKTTLPWLLMQLGAPAWMLSLLVPIRESGSMLPQLWIGMLVRRQSIRKWVWVVGGVCQALCLIAMGWVAVSAQGASAGALIILLLIMFSLSRGACSVAYKDVQGKTIPKTRRGRLSGWISMIAGLAALCAGLLLGTLHSTQTIGIYAVLLLVAAALWILAAISFARIVEEPGATGGGQDGWRAAIDKLALLKEDRPFRNFVIARALALGTGLAAPFYVVLARDNLGDGISLLGLFIAAEGLASLVSSPVWGRWADRSSRQVFACACAMASILTLCVAAWSLLSVPADAHYAFYAFAFFGLGVAHAGVRLGRKTYLVDMAQGNRRTDYVAVSNTVIGALLLLAGLAGGALAMISPQSNLVMFGLAGLLGTAMSLQWKEVSV